MPVLRSSTRLASSDAVAKPLKRVPKSTSMPKRTTKANTTGVNVASKQVKTTSKKTSKSKIKVVEEVVSPRPLNPEPAPSPLPAVLSFSFDEAKNHILRADPRFEDLFWKLECRPFQHLETVDPFRTLTTSILGQQISWLAAKSITHRFRRLFDAALPEKADNNQTTRYTNDSFPTAYQVATTDVATLRTAGLSGRKAEYVQDLAMRFADGRLSNDKILNAEDEELYDLLTAVRGIGRWTVDMFAIFSLRRANILPVGDLGVQRGVALWFLSLHSPKHACEISPKKLPTAFETTESQQQQSQVQTQVQSDTDMEIADAMEVAMQSSDPLERAKTPDIAAFPPAPVVPSTPSEKKKILDVNVNEDAEDLEVPLPPPAFTPSINRTLNRTLPSQFTPEPLPEGLSVKELQARLDGKKKIKGAILTPKEMEELTESWKPYRSLGVYYMWSLSSAYTTKSK